MAQRIRYTAGMSINDVIDAGYNFFAELDEKALREAVNKLGSAVNKRYKSFKSRGESSPAVSALERSGGKISTRGKTVEELKDEYTRAVNYLNSESSKRSTWNRVKGVTVNILSHGKSEEPDIDLEDEEPEIRVSLDSYDKFWDSFAKLRKLDNRYQLSEYRYEAWNRLAKIVDNPSDGSKSADEIAEMVYNDYQIAYQKKEKRYNDRQGGTSNLIKQRDTI